MTIENDEVELPQHLLDLLPTLPEKVDRKAGAQLVSDHIFPTSPKTVKGWPLAWEYPNGRAVEKPANYLRFAYRKARMAPAGIGFGRRAQPQTAEASAN